MFAYFRTVELEHTSTTTASLWGKRCEVVTSPILWRWFEPDLDYRFAGFEAQSAAWDASTEDRLFVDMTDLDTRDSCHWAPLPTDFTKRTWTRQRMCGCQPMHPFAAFGLPIGKPSSASTAVSFSAYTGSGTLFEAADRHGICTVALWSPSGRLPGWEVTFDRLDQEPEAVRGEIGLSLERSNAGGGCVSWSMEVVSIYQCSRVTRSLQ